MRRGAIRQKMVTHLKDLMSDAQLYGWDRFRTFQCVWLNQLEQWRCTWMDEEKLTFCRAMVWHKPPYFPLAPTTTRASTRTSQYNHKSPTVYNALARPVTKDCHAYNGVGCEKGAMHPENQSMCSS